MGLVDAQLLVVADTSAWTQEEALRLPRDRAAPHVGPLRELPPFTGAPRGVQDAGRSGLRVDDGVRQVRRSQPRDPMVASSSSG